MRTTIAAFAVFAFLVTPPAFAQQAPATPLDQALSGKLMDEINQNIQLRAQLLQDEAKIKELQPKPDTEPPPKKVPAPGK